MRRLVCVVIGLALCLAEARAAAPSRWTRLRTQHFVLLGENGDKPLRRVGERLEQFREVFARVFPSTRQTMPAPAIVYVFTSERAYQPFMPLFNGKRVDVGGYGFAGAPQAGQEVVLGVRPEHIHLRDGEGGHGEAAISLVEPMGANQVVWLDAQGTPLAVDADAQYQPRPERRTAFAIDTAQVSLFDRATQARL